MVQQQATPAIVVQAINTVVPNMLTYLANLDTPLPQPPTVLAAFELLVAEMIAATAYLNHGTVPAVGTQTAGTAARARGQPHHRLVGRGFGQPLVAVHLPRDHHGSVHQRCPDRRATAGQEPYTVTGQNAASSPLSYQWLTSAAVRRARHRAS